MASYEKGKYSYNGNTIYYDEAETSAAFKQISSICGDVLDYSESTKNADKCFDGFPSQYSSLFPNPRYSQIARGIEANLNGIQRTVTTKMNQVIGAINDYCNGDEIFSPSNQAILDNLLNSTVPPSSPPKGGPGSGPGGGPGSGGDDSATDDDLTANEEVATEIPNNVPLENTTTNNDEEIVLGEVEGPNGQYSSEAVVPFSNNDENLEAGADGVDGTNSEFGTSLFGSSSFSVPSMLSSEGKVDGIKGAGVLGAAGVAAAAAAAIGGKVFYDKKHSDDEDDEMIDEDIVKMNEESGSDVNSSFMSGLSSVDFKSELLSEMDGDE